MFDYMKHLIFQLLVKQTYDDPANYATLNISGDGYETGYHVFKSKKAAKSYFFDRYDHRVVKVS